MRRNICHGKTSQTELISTKRQVQLLSLILLSLPRTDFTSEDSCIDTVISSFMKYGPKTVKMAHHLTCNEKSIVPRVLSRLGYPEDWMSSEEGRKYMFTSWAVHQRNNSQQFRPSFLIHHNANHDVVTQDPHSSLTESRSDNTSSEAISSQPNPTIRCATIASGT